MMREAMAATLLMVASPTPAAAQLADFMKAVGGIGDAMGVNPEAALGQSDTAGGKPPKNGGVDLRRFLPPAAKGWKSDGDIDPYGMFDPTKIAEQTYHRSNGKDGNVSIQIQNRRAVLNVPDNITLQKLGPDPEVPSTIYSRIEIGGQVALLKFDDRARSGEIQFRYAPYSFVVSCYSCNSVELQAAARSINLSALPKG